MLATIALAMLAFPAPGKYMYAFTTASGAQVAADVWIYATSQGIVTHEEMRSSAPIATTDQHFDDFLYPNWYSGANERGAQLFIHLGHSVRGPSWARLAVAGKTADVKIGSIDTPACVLVLDSGLTSSVILPSLVRATGATVCTFIVASAATAITATVDTAVPRSRPKDASPRDLALTVKIGSATERLWYDPQTLIPDYIDLGRNGTATLAAWTREQ